MCNNDYLGLFLIYFSLYSCVYGERYNLHGMKILQKWLFHLVQGFVRLATAHFSPLSLNLFTIFCAFELFFLNNVQDNSPTDLRPWSFGKCGRFEMSNKRVLCFLIQFNQFVDTFHYGSRLKALNRMSRSPTFAAWNSSGWSIIDRAIRSAAQILPDRAGWGTCCWFLLFLCKLRAVRKLLTASL